METLPAMRILLTRVTRIFQVSVFTKFALAGGWPRSGARTPNLASTPGATSAPVIALLWSCYFSAAFSISYSFSERCAHGPVFLFFPVIYRAAGNQRSAFGSRSRRRRRASHEFVDRAAGDAGAQHAAFELGLLARRALAL